MPARDPLWSDPSAREPERAWLEEPTRPRQIAEPPAPPPPPRRSSLRAVLIGTMAAVVVLLSALAGALIFGGSDGPGRTATTLPAVKGSLPTSRIGSIYAAVSSGVVQIKTNSGSGTGFVIDDGGTIVTNAHVVSGESGVRVIFDDSGRPVSGRVLGTDESVDLAVVKVDPAQAPKLRPLTLGDSDRVQVGDAAIAIGYPLGLDRTVTSGIVSGLGREIQAPNGFSIDKVIQTDAPINPGNSGGPLLDAKGRVIGVNSQIATAGGGSGNVGIGFAVPVNTVREVVPKLEAGQTVKRAYLGVSTSDPITGSGALVQQVTPGGPAERAGLRAATSATGEGGDVIVAVDGKPVVTPDDVVAAVGDRQPGDRVTLEVLRDGQRVSLDATLGERPQSASSPSPTTPGP